jgi:two-component system, NarL family, sensor histidine kinase BarA
MAKGITISLAAKCQLLFGLAVVVIIAGALAVPWQRMEQLAGQQNIKAARMLADVQLRQVHVQAGVPVFTDDRWNAASLPDIPDYPPPRIVVLPMPQPATTGDDALSNEALRQFLSHNRDTEYGRVEDKGRVYRYAAAVRLEANCVKCHSQWQSWAQPGEEGFLHAPATGPASTASGTQQALHPPGVNSATTAVAATAPAPASHAAKPALTNGPLVALIRVDLPWQIDENQLVLNRIVLVVAGMLGGTLAIVVFYLITNRLILQPVRVLRNTAEKVAKGDMNIRSAISTGDEFQQLSETFNTMLVTLQASQVQLEATNLSLDTRVGELAQSNVDLYEANRIKSEFLTNVSHELRTPLNAIIGFAELLSANKAAEDPKVARYLDNIQSSAKQLLDLINDLLDLAKIEAGKVVMRHEKVNVADVCEAMLNFMRPLAQKKEIELTLTVQPDMPLVTTDPGRLQQVLYNFLSNAVKFTPARGAVKISAKLDDGDTVRVSVADTGPGISDKDQEYIFEKFRQIDGSVTRQHSGTGLGLAISRELASLLGGRIELQSTVGKGATFSLILPIGTDSASTTDVPAAPAM